MNETEQPQQRPMSEIKRLVAEDNARYDELSELWGNIMPKDQERLIELAREYASAYDDVPG